jgi:hypothetical protein
VERQFAVVGILEEMEKSLLVMEHYVPRFFSGVSTVYSNRRDWQKQVNKNIYRPQVRTEIRDMVSLADSDQEINFHVAFRPCRFAGTFPERWSSTITASSASTASTLP